MRLPRALCRATTYPTISWLQNPCQFFKACVLPLASHVRCSALPLRSATGRAAPAAQARGAHRDRSVLIFVFVCLCSRLFVFSVRIRIVAFCERASVIICKQPSLRKESVCWASNVAAAMALPMQRHLPGRQRAVGRCAGPGAVANGTSETQQPHDTCVQLFKAGPW